VKISKQLLFAVEADFEFLKGNAVLSVGTAASSQWFSPLDVVLTTS
jgi:hypothetical protein